MKKAISQSFYMPKFFPNFTKKAVSQIIVVLVFIALSLLLVGSMYMIINKYTKEKQIQEKIYEIKKTDNLETIYFGDKKDFFYQLLKRNGYNIISSKLTESSSIGEINIFSESLKAEVNVTDAFIFKKITKERGKVVQEKDIKEIDNANDYKILENHIIISKYFNSPSDYVKIVLNFPSFYFTKMCFETFINNLPNEDKLDYKVFLEGESIVIKREKNCLLLHAYPGSYPEIRIYSKDQKTLLNIDMKITLYRTPIYDFDGKGLYKKILIKNLNLDLKGMRFYTKGDKLDSNAIKGKIYLWDQSSSNSDLFHNYIIQGYKINRISPVDSLTYSDEIDGAPTSAPIAGKTAIVTTNDGIFKIGTISSNAKYIVVKRNSLIERIKGNDAFKGYHISIYKEQGGRYCFITDEYRDFVLSLSKKDSSVVLVNSYDPSCDKLIYIGNSLDTATLTELLKASRDNKEVFILLNKKPSFSKELDPLPIKTNVEKTLSVLPIIDGILNKYGILLDYYEFKPDLISQCIVYQRDLCMLYYKDGIFLYPFNIKNIKYDIKELLNLKRSYDVELIAKFEDDSPFIFAKEGEYENEKPLVYYDENKIYTPYGEFLSFKEGSPFLVYDSINDVEIQNINRGAVPHFRIIARGSKGYLKEDLTFVDDRGIQIVSEFYPEKGNKINYIYYNLRFPSISDYYFVHLDEINNLLNHEKSNLIIVKDFANNYYGIEVISLSNLDLKKVEVVSNRDLRIYFLDNPEKLNEPKKFRIRVFYLGKQDNLKKLIEAFVNELYKKEEVYTILSYSSKKDGVDGELLLNKLKEVCEKGKKAVLLYDLSIIGILKTLNIPFIIKKENNSYYIDFIGNIEIANKIYKVDCPTGKGILYFVPKKEVTNKKSMTILLKELYSQ